LNWVRVYAIISFSAFKLIIKIIEEEQMKFFPVSTTGNLMDDTDTYPITAPVPLPVVFSQITGPFTAFDRKLWLLLLHLEWDSLLTKSKVGEWHEVKESTLRALVIKYIGDRNTERFWDSAKRLADTRVRYERIDENDERWEGACTLFMSEYKSKDKRNGQFRFMFPPPLIPIILEPGKFARLRVEFMLKLDSKYAVTLYQVLESVANLKSPTLTATVDELRGWLKVPEGKLSQWAFLERKALIPAIKEVNSNPELSGIYINYELIRSGKGGKVQKVRFTVQKNVQRIIAEKEIQTTKKAKETARISRLIPPFHGTTIYAKAKKIAPSLDVYYLEKEWRDWVSQSDVAIKNPEAHFMAFVKKKVGK
jgi:plasmid replication initiation protein